MHKDCAYYRVISPLPNLVSVGALGKARGGRRSWGAGGDHGGQLFIFPFIFQAQIFCPYIPVTYHKLL